MIQAKYTAELVQWGLEWGCPFILYWQLYCNELRKDIGKHRGFWMINPAGEKLPVWEMHHAFLKQANAWVDDYQNEHGHLPPQAEFNAAAIDWVQRFDDVAPAPHLFKDPVKP
jgi:hypothetical protein